MSMEDSDFIEVELFKNDFNEFRKTEDSLYNQMDSDRFFALCTKYGYTYNKISRLIDGRNFTIREQQEFNIVLRKLKRVYNIQISESIVFLEEQISLNNILKFIDDETNWVLKEELAEKYFLKDDKNIIFDILY